MLSNNERQSPPQGARAAAIHLRDQVVRSYRIVVSNTDIEMMFRIERFILAYDGDDLLHDIELTFGNVASYRSFYLALMRTRDAARWLDPEGSA